MKIFISWSGFRSKTIAGALKTWLPDIFQNDEIFMSAHDIGAGDRWGNRLNSELGNSNFGIICLTPENLTAPWLLYESGALAKAFEESHVIPYLFELKPTDVSLPLGQFQSVTSDSSGTFKLIESINNSREKSLSNEQLVKFFNKWWPDLETQLNKILPPKEKQPIERPDRELLEEILQVLRSQNAGKLGNMDESIGKARSKSSGGLIRVDVIMSIPPNVDKNEVVNIIHRYLTDNVSGMKISFEIGSRKTPDDHLKAVIMYDLREEFDLFLQFLEVNTIRLNYLTNN